MPKHRTDVWLPPTPRYQWRGLPSSAPNAGNIQDTVITQASGDQDILLSTGHPFQKLGKGSGDIGGAFCVVRREYQDSSPVFHNRTVTNENNALASNYLGGYYAQDYSVTNTDFAVPLVTPDIDLAVLGTHAIARVIPTNPIVSLTTTLGELRREGIPQLVGAQTWRDRTLRARNAGSEYLNVEFGWRPLLNEVQSLAHVVAHSDEIVRQYEAESGELLHRSYSLPSSSTTTRTEDVGTYPTPAFVGGYWNSTGTRVTVTQTSERAWFSGAFTYHLPPEGSLARQAAIANKLLGTRVTPEVLWNLTPWTWAVDWFTNAGDVIHNITAFHNDGLVMPYGYLMKQRQIIKTVSHTGARTKRFNQAVNCHQTFTTTVKQRHKAHPYGFGLQPGSFSSKQWAILGALGLSRGSNQMKYD